MKSFIEREMELKIAHYENVGWRDLNEGEAVRQGDRYISECGNYWIDVTKDEEGYFFTQSHFMHQRRLKC